MIKRIKYTKNIEWVKPFVEAAGSLINLNKITNIRGYKVPVKLNEHTYGSAIKEHGRYSINIRLWNNSRDKKHHSDGSLNMILETLAHELAHIMYFPEHPTWHFLLQSQILVKFAEVLVKTKVTDTSLGWAEWSKTLKEYAKCNQK